MSFARLGKLRTLLPPYRRVHHLRGAREARKARKAREATDATTSLPTQPPILPTQPPILPTHPPLTGAREARKAREAREAYGSNESELGEVSYAQLLQLQCYYMQFTMLFDHKIIIIFKIYILYHEV